MGFWEFYQFFFVIAVTVFGGGGLVFTLPYIILRLRDARSPRRDPQLGVKVALHFLLTVAIFIAAIGLTVIVSELLGAGSRFWSEEMRSGTALLIAGAILGSLHYWVIAMRTNDRRWPLPRRTFAGIRFVIEALVFTAAMCGVLVRILSDRPGMVGDEGAVFIAMLGVWGLAWIIELTLLMKMLRQPETPGLDTRCVMCSYDLRGRGDAVACPECGTLIPAEQRELMRPPQAVPIVAS